MPHAARRTSECAALAQVRTLSDGRHPEHGKTGYTKKHAVDGRQHWPQKRYFREALGMSRPDTWILL